MPEVGKSAVTYLVVMYVYSILVCAIIQCWWTVYVRDVAAMYLGCISVPS